MCWLGRMRGRSTYGHRERRQSWRLNGVLLLCECVRECVRERERAAWRVCVCVGYDTAGCHVGGWSRLNSIRRTELEREEGALGCCQRVAQEDARSHLDEENEASF
jgi:hypothetical protein